MKNFLKFHFSDHNLIARYIIAGGIGACVNLSGMYIFTDVLGVWYIASAVYAFLLSLFVTFILQKVWTFRDALFNKQHTWRQAVLYTCSSVSFLLVNTLILYFLVEVFNFWYLGAQFLSLAFVACGSFLVNKEFTFVQRRAMLDTSDSEKYIT